MKREKITKFVLFAKFHLDSNKKVFIPNGSMYYSKIDFLERERTFFSKSSNLYIMDDFHSIDIDTNRWYHMAAVCVKAHNNNNNNHNETIGINNNNNKMGIFI